MNQLILQIQNSSAVRKLLQSAVLQNQFRILERESKKQCAHQNQATNRLKCWFVDGMALKPNKNTENSADAPPRLCDMSTEEMSSWLSMFVIKIRHQDGKPYSGST